MLIVVPVFSYFLLLFCQHHYICDTEAVKWVCEWIFVVVVLESWTIKVATSIKILPLLFATSFVCVVILH